MKKVFYSALTILFLSLFFSCTSADLYRINYSDDPEMQNRMEKNFGNSPIWND